MFVSTIGNMSDQLDKLSHKGYVENTLMFAL